MLQLQSFSAKNEIVEKALTDSQLRIQSIALVHEMLYQSESLAYIDYGKYVNDLLQAISSMHLTSDKDIELVSDLDSVSLNVNQAIPCSLLLNEVIVNAFKHAFDGRNQGTIKVMMRQADSKILLTVSDNGSGIDIDKFKNSDALGATLIKTLTDQLHGEFDIIDVNEEGGSKFLLEFTKKE